MGGTSWMSQTPVRVVALCGFPGAERSTRPLWHGAQPNSITSTPSAVRHPSVQSSAGSPAWGCFHQCFSEGQTKKHSPLALVGKLPVGGGADAPEPTRVCAWVEGLGPGTKSSFGVSHPPPMQPPVHMGAISALRLDLNGQKLSTQGC